MKVTFVGVAVSNRAELQAVYDKFVALGYSESHSINVNNMEKAMEQAHRDGEVFGLCIDRDRDILGVFEFDVDKIMSPIVRCDLEDLGAATHAFFPL